MFPEQLIGVIGAFHWIQINPESYPEPEQVCRSE